MTEPMIDPRLVESDRRAHVAGLLLDVVSRFGGRPLQAGLPMSQMVTQLADVVEQLAREGWLPPSEWVPNDIEATGQCCCAGCIGEGRCDLDGGRSEDGRGDDSECEFCPSDCQICSDTPDCDCPTHGEE